MNYSAGETYCANEYGTNLATITSSAEQIQVSVAAWYAGITVANESDKRYWFGLNDELSEGTYEWTDGVTMFNNKSYTNWLTNQPSGSTGENCGQVYPDGTWDDDLCTSNRYIVCNARMYFYLYFFFFFFWICHLCFITCVLYCKSTLRGLGHLYI